MVLASRIIVYKAVIYETMRNLKTVKMKKSKTLVVLLLLTFMFTLCVGVVQAPPLWDSIQSGYAVTTNKFGEGILLCVDEVIAMAGTTDTSVTVVEFRWFPPGEEEVPAWNETVSDWEWDSWKTIDFRRYNSSTYALDIEGDWGIQVFFKGPEGQLRHTTDIIKIRATTGMVIPEVGLSTLAIMFSMLGALGAYKLRRKLF